LKIRVAETVTVRFEDADALAVLSFLGKTAGIEIRFAPNTPSTPIILDVRNANVAEVFKTVLEVADLSFEVVDEKTVLVSR
jgi:hypothetical protein